MVLIHEKITALLEQRRLKKRDLARALGVSPQTATDICKGRSAITLPHLRNLVSFFEIRAEFWLDDDRLAPEEVDQVTRKGTADAIQRTGLLAVEDPAHLIQRLRSFVQEHREAFLARFPDLTLPERGLLGLAEGGATGQLAAGASGAAEPAPDERSAQQPATGSADPAGSMAAREADS
ncbi:MAG: helix-turn-helix domain-containing protein [Planctomycetes bacterium]|nr:helix-turn-helix domain-containing protein [Planctomycetota bacterium]